MGDKQRDTKQDEVIPSIEDMELQIEGVDYTITRSSFVARSTIRVVSPCEKES